MNTMFFTDEPLGTIPYDYVEELQRSGLTNAVVPFTMGDSFNSARIVGTTPAFLDGKPLAQGEMFAEVYEAVVGADVAKTYSLKVGDSIVTSHGLNTSGAAHTASPLTVVGILKTTGTAYDNAVFTPVSTIWELHEHHDGDHDEDHDEDHEEHEEHEEHHHAGAGEICAVRLSSDLSRAVGEPKLLFRASQGAPSIWPYREINWVTDGPFLLRTDDGRLHLLWSSFGEGGYVQALAHSNTDGIDGHWTVDRELLFDRNGGHGMIFRDFAGQYFLTLHSPNKTLMERPVFRRLSYENGAFRVCK